MPYTDNMVDCCVVGMEDHVANGRRAIIMRRVFAAEELISNSISLRYGDQAASEMMTEWKQDEVTYEKSWHGLCADLECMTVKNWLSSHNTRGMCAPTIYATYIMRKYAKSPPTPMRTLDLED